MPDGLPSDMDPEEAYKLMKGSLKFQPIKNSLAHLDKDVGTPRFNLKSRVGNWKVLNILVLIPWFRGDG